MTAITAASFPTPDLARRGGDGAEQQRVAAFAQHQADAADTLRSRLAADWHTLDVHGRMAALRAGHAETIAWRYTLALQAPRRLGEGLPLDARRFVTPLRDGGPNSDRLGYLGRLRDGAAWDPATRTYRGGASTPAHDVMLRYGQLALARMDREVPGQDTLVNVVRLGRRRLVRGNQLVRGAAGSRIADQMVQRIAARGGDTSRIETGGDPVYVVTARPDDADELFEHALMLLAAAGSGDVEHADRVRAWQDARYLLYQAPRMKKGSDAVTRVFLVAVGAVLLGQAPVLDHDVDLWCMVRGQAASVHLHSDAKLYAAA